MEFVSTPLRSRVRFALKLGAAFSAATLLSSVGVAANLFTPFGLDSAQVLPKGVRNLHLLGFTTQISNKLDGSGQTLPVGDGFNRSLKVRELVDSQPAGFERGKLRGGLEAYGINMDSEAGHAYGVVNSRVTTTVPIAAYGVTDDLSIAVAVPIIYSKTSTSTGWVVNDAFEAKIKALAPKGYANKIQSLKSQLINVVSTKIAADGYKPLDSQYSATELGDVTLGAKYRLFKRDKWAAALSPRLTLPTGRTQDVDKVVDVAPGTGVYSAGLAAIVDYSMTSRLTLTPSVSYLYPFARRMSARVPLNGDETLTPDVDRDVTFKSGDTVAANLALKILADEAVVIGLGYGFQSKPGDSYTGSAYSSDRYQYISKDTAETLHGAQATMTYSTLPAFRRKEFAVPLDLTLGLATVLGGTNVNRAALTSLDLAAYF